MMVFAATVRAVLRRLEVVYCIQARGIIVVEYLYRCIREVWIYWAAMIVIDIRG